MKLSTAMIAAVAGATAGVGAVAAVGAISDRMHKDDPDMIAADAESIKSEDDGTETTF